MGDSYLKLRNYDKKSFLFIKLDLAKGNVCDWAGQGLGPDNNFFSATFQKFLEEKSPQLTSKQIFSFRSRLKAICDTNRDVCYATRCLSRNAVYLTFAKRNFSSRCPNCPMSPNIFAHLEFLSIAGNYLSNFLLIGFVTGDRWVNGFSGISWCKEFTGIFSPTTSVGRFRLTFGFNLFRSTIKRFKVSQAVLGSLHAFQDALPNIFFRLPFHFFLSTFSTYLQDGTLVLHMLHLKHKNLDNDIQMWPKITTP